MKTCAGCEVLRMCDAHVTGGEWKHRQGIDPCQVVLHGGDLTAFHTDPCIGCEKSDCRGCPTYNFLSNLDPSTGRE
jgi:hypothetical protein